MEGINIWLGKQYNCSFDETGSAKPTVPRKQNLGSDVSTRFHPLRILPALIETSKLKDILFFFSTDNMIVEVTLLDGSADNYEMDGKSSGQDLLDTVSDKLNLVEKDYFGFLFIDHRDKTLTWLHSDRKLNKQLKGKNFRISLSFPLNSK